jgi:UDP-2,3-diacylglucosamine hydrolase
VSGTLTILAGGGHLPGLLAESALAQGYTVAVITFTGQPQPGDLPSGISQTARMPLAKVGQILNQLAQWQTTHVILAGHLSKPGIMGLAPDAEGMKLLAGIGLTRVGKGDDTLLTAVTKRLANAGYMVLGVPDLAPQLLAPAGTLSKRAPTQSELADARTAQKLLNSIGDFDIGQSCIIMGGTILGIEGPEGTDALIDRCALLRGPLKPREHAGLLVKLAKPNQSNLADLPTLGPITLTKLADLNFVGAVVLAGRTLLLNQPELTRLTATHHLLLHALEQ